MPPTQGRIILVATKQGKGRLALNNESAKKLRAQLNITETSPLDINLKIRGKTFPAVAHYSNVRYDKKNKRYVRRERITIPQRVVRGAKLQKGKITFSLVQPKRHQQIRRHVIYPSVMQRSTQLEFFWVENVITLDPKQVYATLLRDMRSAPRGYDSVGAQLAFIITADNGDQFPMIISFPETPVDIAYINAPNQFAKFVKVFVEDAFDTAFAKMEQPYVRSIILYKHTAHFTKPVTRFSRTLNISRR